MGNVEIFKETESGLINNLELNLITKRSPNFRSHWDKANNIMAFALCLNRTEADWLVDELNELENGGDWYLGDEQEEYVFVN